MIIVAECEFKFLALLKTTKRSQRESIKSWTYCELGEIGLVG